MIRLTVAILTLGFFMFGCGNSSSTRGTETTPPATPPPAAPQATQPVTITKSGKFPLSLCLNTLEPSMAWSTGHDGGYSLTYYHIDYHCYLKSMIPPEAKFTFASIEGAVDLGKDMLSLYGEKSIHITAEIPKYDESSLRIKYFWSDSDRYSAELDVKNRLSNAILTISYQEKQ